MLSTVALLLGVAVICAATDGNGHPDLKDRTSCDGGSSQSHVDTTARLQELRQLMSSPIDNLYQPLAAYIVPMDDEHLSEYISPHDGLVRYISGFTGSAGVAVVTADRAAIWTDGRYFLQAEQQLDCNWILMKEDTGAPERFEWLKAQLKSEQLVGADPTRMSALTWIQLKEQLQVAGIDLVTVDVNLIEHMWTEDRPALKTEPIFVHPLEYAGMSLMDKVLEVRKKMAASAKGSQQVEALLVTQLDEVAWLLNLRGSDMPHTPEFKGYAVVERNGVLLFVNTSQVPEQVRTHLKSAGCTPQKNGCVVLKEYDAISDYVGDMSTGDWRDGLVWIPSRWSYSGGASFALYNKVPESQRLFEPSPIIRLKAMKNPTEVKSMRNAHVRDSAALSDFLSLLEQSVRAGDSWTEMSVAARLQQFRAEQKLFRGTSFGTISAFGPHGAVIHYKPTQQTDAAVDTSSLLLLDSGGQYLDGTTDVTRTMHYGEPEDFQKEAYTRVLMGVIDLARVVFKPGTTDTRLDILARQHLWRVGLDYLHGTGHGIGLFLQVHEAPTQLRVYSKEEHPLEEGMFFSNEPGYYEAGRFGVRLETIMYVTRATNLRHNFSGPYLKLEPATLVPFERNLIKLNLFSQDQVDWLNDYHQLIRDTVGQTLMDQGRERAYRWLLEKTQRISTRRECPTTNSAENPHVTAVSIVLVPAVLFLLSATRLW